MKPKTRARVYLAVSAIWGLLLVPSIIWWRESVVWLVVMSWYANFGTSLSGWEAAKAAQEAADSQ
jgi:hypothetical protein